MELPGAHDLAGLDVGLLQHLGVVGGEHDHLPLPVRQQHAAGGQAGRAGPAAAPAAAAPNQSIASLIDNISGYRIQLASVRSEEQAQATWARMQKSNGDVLSSLTMRAIKVDLGDRGIYYRVQAGPLDEGGAQSACSKLKSRSVDCIVVKP